MRRSAGPVPITEEDGPFRYVYVAIAAVPGIKLPGDAKQVDFYSFADLGASAFLTADSAATYFHMDRSAALGLMLLTAFRGRSRFGVISGLLDRVLTPFLGAERMFQRRLLREAQTARVARDKQTNPGCYLVYKAEGDLLEPANLAIARKVGKIGFGFDIITGSLYRERHKSSLHSAATAVSLALVDTTASPEIHISQDIIYLAGRDGLVVYPKNIQGGVAGAIVSSQLATETIQAATNYIPAMVDDGPIETAISLFTQSQRKENDNLRSFIAAWSALELLVNRLERLTRDDWRKLLEAEWQLPEWDKDLRGVGPEEYRMRDRFFIVACVFDLTHAAEDAQTFTRINNVRSGFYHRLDVRDVDLPTGDVQTLFRRYLKTSLSRKRQR